MEQTQTVIPHSGTPRQCLNYRKGGQISSWLGLHGLLKACFRFNWNHALQRNDSQEQLCLVQLITLSQALWLSGKETASPQSTAMCRKG